MSYQHGEPWAHWLIIYADFSTECVIDPPVTRGELLRVYHAALDCLPYNDTGCIAHPSEPVAHSEPSKPRRS
jgi:hypothetical protein